MKQAAAALFLLLLLALPGLAHGGAMDLFRKGSLPEVYREKYAQLDTFIENYYLSPEPAQVLNYLRTVDKLGMLSAYPHAAPVLTGFMSALVAVHPQGRKEWLSSPDQFGEQVLDVLRRATWIAGRARDPALNALYAVKPDYLQKEPPRLLDMKVASMDDAALLWGAFFATGNAAYGAKVFDACAGGDQYLCVVVRYFATQHILVLRQLENAIAAEKDETRLTNLRKGLPPRNLMLENRDGEFGAQLLVTDFEKAAAILSKTDVSLLALPEKTWADTGERAIFLILFTGMTLDDNLTARLEFDMHVTDPDGNSVPKTEYQAEKVVPAKFRTNFGIHSHTGSGGIYFGRDKPPGMYTVSVELRDKLSGKKIAMTKKINFLKKR